MKKCKDCKYFKVRTEKSNSVGQCKYPVPKLPVWITDTLEDTYQYGLVWGNNTIPCECLEAA